MNALKKISLLKKSDYLFISTCFKAHNSTFKVF